MHCWYEIKRIIDIAQLELNIKTLFHVTLQLKLWIALHETEQSGHYGKWRFLHSPIPCFDIPEKCHFLLYLQFWCCCFNLLCKLENCVLWAYIMSCLLQNLSFWSHNVKIRDSFVFSKYLQILVFYFFLLFVCLKWRKFDVVNFARIEVSRNLALNKRAANHRPCPHRASAHTTLLLIQLQREKG